VHGHVLVAFLEARVFLDVVEIVATDDARALHLHLRDDPRQDTTADRHVPRERTLLVDVRPRRRLFRGLEAETNAFHISEWLFRLLFTDSKNAVLVI